MRRREFMAALGGSAAAWPLAVHAQHGGGGMRRVAVFLNLPEKDPEGERSVAALREGLQSFGWVEGLNLKLDILWSPRADTGRIRSMAAEVVESSPDLILASATEVLAAFRDETRTIPIVFVSVSDPVGQGFVSNLAQPGDNITGFTAFEFSMGGKWIELLKEIAPSTTSVGVLFNPKTAPYHASFMGAIQSASGAFGTRSRAIPVGELSEIEPAIVALAREPGAGLICPSDSFTSVHRKTIIPLVAQHRVPAIYTWREFALDGALITYGIDRIDPYRRAASYVDRVLKGAKPGDLPIQQPTKFVLAVNITAARALGLTIPLSLLARADEVIE
jgi:putative ABC transport system substrate-binding protein